MRPSRRHFGMWNQALARTRGPTAIPARLISQRDRAAAAVGNEEIRGRRPTVAAGPAQLSRADRRAHGTHRRSRRAGRRCVRLPPGSRADREAGHRDRAQRRTHDHPHPAGALDVGSLRGASAARARARLAVGSALFGLLRADDPVPPYRLSASSKLPGRPTLAARWKPVLEPALAGIAAEDLVVDLRSGSYAALGRLDGAVRVNVLAEHADGHRTVVSHFNKAHKGKLARALVSSRSEPDDAAKVAAVARKAGMRVERTGNELVIVVPT